MKDRDPLLEPGLDEEIRHHLQERADWLAERGMSERAARREAERRFGNVRRVRAELRRIDRDKERTARLSSWLDSTLQDLRIGLRGVRQAPAFATAVVLTVALGVGANVAIFSVLDAVLLRPLPYTAPEELYSLLPHHAEKGRTLGWMSPHQATTWARAAAGEVELLVHAGASFVRTDGDRALQVTGQAVTVNWLRLLGAQPAVGRTFVAEEGLAGADRAVILSDEFWREQTAADADVLGSSMTLDGLQYTVIGVMGPEFRFPPTRRTQAWVPLPADAVVGRDPVDRISAVVRLDAERTVAAVEERLDAIGAGLQEADPQDIGWALRTQALDFFRANSDTERALWVLAGAAGAMLLIAISNAANLLLARASTRATDLSVRAALGASSVRLVRQQLTENTILVVAGGASAIVIARLLVELLVGLLPFEVTAFLVGEVHLDQRVLLFALGATVLVALALGLLPAVRSGSSGELLVAGRTASAGRGTKALRSGLVVTEIAVSVTLLAVAGLLISSFVRLTAVDPGYDAGRLLQVSLSLPEHDYPDAAARSRFFRGLRDDLRLLPGVASVSLALGVPPSSSISFGIKPQAEGGEPQDLPGLWLPHADVDPEYFTALGVPIVAGRNFTAADSDGSVAAASRRADKVIIDRDLARFLFGAANPIGRRFRLDPDAERWQHWLTVVGLIEDVKLMGRDDRRGTMDLFFPLRSDAASQYMSLVVRTSVNPASLKPDVRRVVRDRDPQLPVYELATGTETLSESVEKPRFFVRLMASFGAIALLLAAIGTYGVLEFAVRQRTREIGVRVALGADARRVQAMVLRHGLGLAAVGLTLGLGGALAAGRVAGALLFGTEPADPLTLAGVAGVMIGTVMLACWVPARRATRVDPVEVLRAE